MNPKKSKLIARFFIFSRFRRLKPWAKVFVIAAFLAIGSLAAAQSLGLIDIFSSEPKASQFRGKTIVLIKPIATGVGEGRHEAGDVVEIRDGDRMADLLGRRPLLSETEKHDFLVVYYDGKLSEEQKELLMAKDEEITGTDEKTGEPVTKLKKIRKAGIDYTQFLTAEEVMKVRQFEFLGKIPQINTSYIKVKGEKEVSVVEISSQFARAEKVFNFFRRGVEKVSQIVIPKALAVSDDCLNNGNCIVDPGGGTGYDYLSLSVWNTGRQGDLVTRGHSEIAKCRATGGTADTSPVFSISGWNTDSTHYVKIWTDPSESYRHDGKWNTGKYLLQVSNAIPITITNFNSTAPGLIYLEGLQIESTNPGAASRNLVDFSYSANSLGIIYITESILKGHGNGSYYQRGINYNQSTYGKDHIYVRNVVIFGLATGLVNNGGIYFNGNTNGGNMNAGNVTVNGAAYSYYFGGGSKFVVVNCISSHPAPTALPGFLQTPTTIFPTEPATRRAGRMIEPIQQLLS